jgi:hypothetical protein
MRLLKFGGRGELSVTKNLSKDIPSYAILSHTWDTDEENEVTFDDIKNGSGKSKASGYAKIQFCGKQALRDSQQYFWVDTCCIDKANHTEFAEAITSMFRWYRNAARCYVYLSDVTVRERDIDQTERPWEPAFRNSKWFTRGWTLQELLAPKSVEFFSREGESLGNKNTLEQQIHEITGIPIEALRGTTPLSDFSFGERMRWASKRDTKKKEDKAYCLQGIFGVVIPLLYGEEEEKAFERLQREIDESSRSKAAREMDNWIREECYSPANLKIERLSGETLPMDQCYINLAIVQQHHQDARSTGGKDAASGDSNAAQRSSPFSLLARLRVKEQNEGTHVPLSTIFDSRKGRDGHKKQPRRVLIRGQAGVGKTTLCKKMVYDFTYGGIWTKFFSRLLWIPLRKLKGKAAGYNIQDLFRDAFFFNHVNRTHIARKLHEAVVDSSSSMAWTKCLCPFRRMRIHFSCCSIF